MFGKPKEVEMLETPKISMKVPEPPAALPKFDNDINEKLDKIMQMLAAHHEIILQKLEPIPEAIVLDEKELKLIPEEDKDTYLEMKKNNPKMAKRLLEGYKNAKD